MYVNANTPSTLRDSIRSARREQEGWTYHLYVLRVERGNYYVGITSDTPAKHIRAQCGVRGVAWTRLHPPIALVETMDTRTQDFTTATQRQNILTWTYMQRFGWKRVRGGYFCSTDEAITQKNLATHGYFKAPIGHW
jgi:predicted GIY-YIG superfamily endonuclease